MPSRQDAALARFHSRLWACRDYSEVTRLASQYSYEPIFVHKGCAEWCLSRDMKKEASRHAVGPIILGLQYPNAYYDDVLDANAIGQCIFCLFLTTFKTYTLMPFHNGLMPLHEQTRGSGQLNIWGRLFCLAYCYLSKSIQLLHAVPDRQVCEPYEARAQLTMAYLSRFDLSIPYRLQNEMVAYDCLAYGRTSEAAGYPDCAEDNVQWRSLATEFINRKEPMRLKRESLESMAESGAKVIHAFFKERENNFIENKKYLCTVEQVEALVLN